MELSIQSGFDFDEEGESLLSDSKEMSKESSSLFIDSPIDVLLLPWRIHRASLFAHGVGIVLYFEMCWFLCMLYLLCLVSFLVEWLIHRKLDHAWWTLFHPWAVFGSITILCASTVLYQQKQLRIWSAVMKVCSTVSSRSVLVSSPALLGTLSLVPSGQEIATFFSERFGPVDNVLVLLNIGKLVKLWRLRKELEFLCLQTEKENQRWRPLLGFLARLSCCRTARYMAKKAGEMKRDRYERWIASIDSKVQDEIEMQQVDSLGCAVVTFVRPQDAVYVLEENEDQITFKNEPEDFNVIHYEESENSSEAGSPEDHAYSWWFSPSVLSKTRFGDDKQPMFVRIAPEPDDINFEGFHKDITPSLPSMRRMVLIGVLSIGCFLTGIAAGFLVEEFSFSLWTSFVFVIFLVLLRLLLFFTSMSVGLSILPPIMFATFSLEQREKFRLGYIFVSLLVLGFIFGIIQTLVSSSETVVLLFLLVTSYQMVSLVMAFLLPKLMSHRFYGVLDGCNLPLGYFYAETISSAMLSFIVLSWAPHVLLSSLILHFSHYVALKSLVLSFPEPVTPRYGPEISISAVNVLPRIAWISCGFAVYKTYSDNVGYPGVALGIWAIVTVFASGWHWASQSQNFLFRYPSVGNDINKEVKSGLRDNGTGIPIRQDHREAKVDISFESGQTTNWQAGLSTRQMYSSTIKRDSYMLPVTSSPALQHIL